MTQKEIERKSLIISSIVNFIIAGAGLWVFYVTEIQALFLDFFFSFIGFTSSLVAVLISAKSKKKTKIYPDGMFFLEPLYGILKSLLVISLLTMTVTSTAESAYDYFTKGVGNVMNIGPVLPYTLLMVMLCFGLGIFNQIQNKKINDTSTILKVEAKSNFIDGLQSLGVGIAIVILYFIDVKSSLGFLHYTGDFFITLALALISIKQPIKALLASFVELSSGVTHDKKIKNSINEIILDSLKDSIKNIKCNIYKTGTHIKVKVILQEKINDHQYKKMIQLRKEILVKLQQRYEDVELVYQF